MRAGRILEIEDFSISLRPRIRIRSFIEQYAGIINHDVQSAPLAGESLMRFSEFVGNAMLIDQNC